MPLLHLALFLTTLLSTTAQGAAMAHAGYGMFPLRDGLSFSIPLMTILLCHEMGHYVAARIHRVPTSLPYFVPLPPGIGMFGTMGAVILQSRTTDRRKLMDIGAAGPLAGLLVAIPVLVYGLYLSPVGPSEGGFQEGNSLLYAVLKRLVCGEWLPGLGRDVNLHPIAFAGWAGLLVTMLNLLPVGQLDGGHVAIAFFGNRYGRTSQWLRRMLLPLSIGITALVYSQVSKDLSGRNPPHGFSPWNIALPAGSVWLVWFVMLGLLRRLSGGVDHPPVDDRPLPANRTILFWVVLMTFLTIFMPIPFRTNIEPAPRTEILDRATIE